jgi:hypothetical protein
MLRTAEDPLVGGVLSEMVIVVDGTAAATS